MHSLHNMCCSWIVEDFTGGERHYKSERKETSGCHKPWPHSLEAGYQQQESRHMNPHTFRPGREKPQAVGIAESMCKESQFLFYTGNGQDLPLVSRFIEKGMSVSMPLVSLLNDPFPLPRLSHPRNPGSVGHLHIFGATDHGDLF